MKIILGIIFVLMIFTIPQVFANTPTLVIQTDKSQYYINEIVNMYGSVTPIGEYDISINLTLPDNSVIPGFGYTKEGGDGSFTVIFEVVQEVRQYGIYHVIATVDNISNSTIFEIIPPPLEFQTDKQQYNQIETINITGQFNNYNIPDNSLANITFQMYDDTHIIPPQTTPITNNQFTLLQLTDSISWESYLGQIKITATYLNMSDYTMINYSSYPEYLTLEYLHDQIQLLLQKITILEMEEEHVLFCGNTESHYNLIMGTNKADVIYGTDGPDLIFGENGHDIIYGYGGHDCIFGDNGNDIIFGGDGDDTIYGDHGNDTIYGGNGNDTAYGGDGNDNDAGNDTCIDVEITFDCTISNQEEPPIPDMPNPEEILYCGKPIESYNSIIDTPNNNGIFEGTDNIDLILGTDGDDTVIAKRGSDCIYTYGGNDIIDAGKGHDTIYAGPGDDYVNGGRNDDTIYGGTGYDIIDGNTETDTCIDGEEWTSCEIIE